MNCLNNGSRSSGPFVKRHLAVTILMAAGITSRLLADDTQASSQTLPITASSTPLDALDVRVLVRANLDWMESTEGPAAAATVAAGQKKLIGIIQDLVRGKDATEARRLLDEAGLTSPTILDRVEKGAGFNVLTVAAAVAGPTVPSTALDAIEVRVLVRARLDKMEGTTGPAAATTLAADQKKLIGLIQDLVRGKDPTEARRLLAEAGLTGPTILDRVQKVAGFNVLTVGAAVAGPTAPAGPIQQPNTAVPRPTGRGSIPVGPGYDRTGQLKAVAPAGPAGPPALPPAAVLNPLRLREVILATPASTLTLLHQNVDPISATDPRQKVIRDSLKKSPENKLDFGASLLNRSPQADRAEVALYVIGHDRAAAEAAAANATRLAEAIRPRTAQETAAGQHAVPASEVMKAITTDQGAGVQKEWRRDAIIYYNEVLLPEGMSRLDPTDPALLQAN